MSLLEREELVAHAAILHAELKVAQEKLARVTSLIEAWMKAMNAVDEQWERCPSPYDYDADHLEKLNTKLEEAEQALVNFLAE